MIKRWVAVAAVVALGLALGVSGKAPKYTARQAAIDMPAYEPSQQFYDSKWDKCVAEYLFQRLRPADVKAIVQGADLGYQPTIETDAEYYCDGSPTTSSPGVSGVAPSSASLDHPSK